MYITLDDYYTTLEYNQSIQALKNNNKEFKEFISIKSPFNWYIKIDEEPIMVNYDLAKKSDVRFLVNKVQTLKDNEEYLFQRKDDSNSSKGVTKYSENIPLREARFSDYSCFFNAINQEQLIQISKELPVKIYYFGRYLKKYKVCLCTNKMILNFINKDQILLEKEQKQEPGRFEAELNYKVFKNLDFLDKYTFTPYFENGSYKKGNIKGNRDIATRFKI